MQQQGLGPISNKTRGYYKSSGVP